MKFSPLIGALFALTLTVSQAHAQAPTGADVWGIGETSIPAPQPLCRVGIASQPVEAAGGQATGAGWHGVG